MVIMEAIFDGFLIHFYLHYQSCFVKEDV